MSIHDGLYTYLKTVSAVTSIVGTGDNCRVYPMQAPRQVTAPYITYQEVSSVHNAHMRAAAGLAEATFQINCWGTTSEDATGLAEAIRGAFQGYLGGTWGSIAAKTCFVDSIHDDFFPPEDNSETGFFRSIVEVRVFYAES